MNQPRAFLAAAIGAVALAGALGQPGLARAQAPITINPNPRPAAPAVPTTQQIAPAVPGILPPPGAIPRTPPAAAAAAAAAAAEETQAIATLCAEIAGQQAIMADNQKQMDTKLAVIAENMRLARIYAARGGGPAAGPR